VLYQIYPRSFADADGDGVGDLKGITAHLEHLAWLGIDGAWLSPITVSPNADWGYDVADYCAVDPSMGTMADFDDLLAEADRLGIRVLLDLVANHTSDRHPWFAASRSSRSSPRRDWYVWADPGPGGAPPNNWVSSCGGAAWTLDSTTGQYYLHNHLPEQPDLNWWHEEVRSAFDAVLRFWFDRGVAGFRIDVCNLIVKDRALRDNPPAGDDDPLDVRLLGQRVVFNGNRPEVHDVLRRWRRLADGYDPARVLVGETPVPVEELAAYYGAGDELHLAFNFPFLSSAFEAAALQEVVAATEGALAPGSWPVWTGSNHDMGRLATRWAGGDEAKARVALVLLLCLRGTPVLYQGDEIALLEGDLGRDELRDPLGVRFWPAYAGRDGSRTPMPWHGRPGGGFSAPEVAPWLALRDLRRNVEDQRGDPRSVLVLVRDLIALRRARPDLTAGGSSALPAPPGVWAWRRGRDTVVALNMTEAPAALGGVWGRVLVGSDRGDDGRRLDGRLDLRPWSAAVVAADAPG